MSKRKSRHFIGWFLVALAVLVVFVVVRGIGLKRTGDEVLPPVVDNQDAPVWYSTLDGTPVSSADTRTPRVVGVMIDNNNEAFGQQVGLSSARVVYEALAEGGITRYLALFNADEVIEKVGPVRSARPYYINWLREYGETTYWHSGGSPDALAMIKKYEIPSVNEFYNGRYYWRDHAYYAPHNLFTKSALWQSFFIARKITTSSWDSWAFEEAGHSETNTSSVVSGIRIAFAPYYCASWKFDGTAYVRLACNGEKITEVVSANTVVVQEVKTSIIDDVGRKDIENVGSGVVRIFKHGKSFSGTWIKKSPTDRTQWFNDLGEVISLAPGKIWIEVVSPTTPVTITN